MDPDGGDHRLLAWILPRRPRTGGVSSTDSVKPALSRVAEKAISRSAREARLAMMHWVKRCSR